MQWWKGKLYVGSQRAYACAERAVLAKYNPLVKYPPVDPTYICTPDARDLPLRGEIWRWTPDANNPSGAGLWQMVYQSPNDVPIPNTNPQKYTAREMGFRDMAVFTESDGTESLYVSGTSAGSFIDGLPPPRILRSSDGNTFTEIPSDPGTFLGSLGIIENINISSFNRMTVYNNRLYVVAGGDFGHGVILEASNPAGGNDNFRIVSPPGMTVTYLHTFNNFLYVAQGAQPISGSPPYAIFKTDAAGAPPYTYQPIMTGLRLPSYNTASSSQSVANMFAVGNQLWIGSNQPAELVRVNPDDTWDLFMGQPRQISDGSWKYPATGMGDGFDWFSNIHIHRMQAHDGFLYLASNDQSNSYTSRSDPTVNALFSSRYGFDLLRSKSGWYLNPVTLTGFEDKDPGGHDNLFNYTGRVAQSTPYGLFFGTGNDQFGEQIWRANAGGATVAPPEKLEGEPAVAGGFVLSWLPSPAAVRYHIFRADYSYGFQLGVPFYIGALTIYPTPFVEVGTTEQTTFSDTASGLAHQYYVVAENASGARSNASNMIRVPTLAEAVSLSKLQNTLARWQASGELTAELQGQLKAKLQFAGLVALFGQYALAETAVQQAQALISSPSLVDWRVEDLNVLLGKMARRLDLARQGMISGWVLF